MISSSSKFFTFTLIAVSVVFSSFSSLHASEADERIESAFTKSYAYRIYLSDDAIKAEAKNGVLILTGQVAEASHKYLAQETAADLQGVEKVDNRLKVNLEGNEESDTWVRAKVRSVLALHRNVSGTKTQVDIHEGVITLRGAATSDAQRDLATEYAQDVKGVLRVTNVMTVAVATPKADETDLQTVDDASITAQVRVALLSHRSTSSVNTKIGTVEGVVTVTGNARNLAEKTLVTKLATDISGVKSVVNNMSIAAGASYRGLGPEAVQGLRLISANN